MNQTMADRPQANVTGVFNAGAAAAPAESPGATLLASGMRQLPLDLKPPEAIGLNDYLEGGNEEMLAWLRAWPASAQPGTPMYLWGPAGCGKTHLLRGMAELALGHGWHVLLLGREGFQSWGPEGDQPTLVLIDDCDALDQPRQHWAFNLFIETAAAVVASAVPQATALPQMVPIAMAIVAAGRLPPVDLPLREDLRTRLGWGAVFNVNPLDEEGVKAVLLRDAHRRGLKLGEGVLPYLMTRFSRDLGSLLSLLERLDRYALAAQRVVTIPLLKQMLALET